MWLVLSSPLRMVLRLRICARMQPTDQMSTRRVDLKTTTRDRFSYLLHRSAWSLEVTQVHGTISWQRNLSSIQSSLLHRPHQQSPLQARNHRSSHHSCCSPGCSLVSKTFTTRTGVVLAYQISVEDISTVNVFKPSKDLIDKELTVIVGKRLRGF